VSARRSAGLQPEPRRPAELLRAISVRQPWAWAIIHAGKDCENRSMAAAKSFRPAIGRRVYIHASSYRWDLTNAAAYLKARGIVMPPVEELSFGGVIGSVSITDIVTAHSSPWFRGPAALVLADPRPEPFLRLRGQVGLFRVESP